MKTIEVELSLVLNKIRVHWKLMQHYYDYSVYEREMSLAVKFDVQLNIQNALNSHYNM